MHTLTHSKAKSVLLQIAALAILLLTAQQSIAQGDSSCVGYPNIGQKKIMSISVGGSPGNPRYVSLLQYTPGGYDENDENKLYPVMIYFPGNGTASESGGVDPCRLLSDQPTSLPAKMADRLFRDSAYYQGVWHKFIVLSPQYNKYYYDGNNGVYDFPTPESVDSLIDYALSQYRIDPTRVYLTGMSAGANIVIQYASSSIERAQRVAAISIASTCSQVGVYPNASNAASIIASAGLATRFISCPADEYCGNGPALSWINGINAASPLVAPEFISLDQNTAGQTFSCEGFKHNTWNKLYDSSFRYNGKNLLEWSIQYTGNAALPVKLESYTARLSNGKVFLNWSSSREQHAATYTIERAGADQQYTELATLAAKGNSNQLSQYAYVDERPQTGLNLYRLVQTDADGRRTIFEVRSVVDSRNLSAKLLVYPNPIQSEFTAYLNIKRTQKVSLVLTDMNGRVLKSKTAFYGEGNTGINLSVATLPKGVYFLRAQGEDFTAVQKLVKE